MLRSNIQNNAESRISHPSFIDLRRFAKAGVCPPIDIAMDAFLSSRRVLELPDGPVEVGAIYLDMGQGSVDNLSTDEFVIVCSGSVVFQQADRVLKLEKNASALLPHDAGFTWSCEAPTTLIYVRYRGSVAGDGSIVAINEAAMLEPSGSPLAELLVGPTPKCRNHTDYLSADGEFMCGTWDSTPYYRKAMHYRHFELMYLLDGSVTFEDETGLKGTFVKGDIFMVEQHAQCSWESLEHVKKVYVIYRPS
ncbi:cupin domain-containing protein [Nitrincola sp. MINF-07-Sa-05]|uniref:cupin domain-containing protein n=1 Tax=Nitrincola salilacus TaxID=3400273 RepID=UPI0039181DF2